jgi:membrane-bound metal-dependent hydrolase YbcI (DUF457 family)
VFVGHSLLAFALAAGVAARAGRPRRWALTVGTLAAGFALLPDIDVAYAVVGPITADPDTAVGAAKAFWSASTVTHRTVTHSLVVGAVLAGAVAAAARRDRAGRAGATLLLAGLGAVLAAVGGALELLLLASAALPALALAEYAARRGVTARTVGLAAAVGLLTHPFGDLFTGEPPALLYPFEVVLVADRVTFSGEATLALLGAMAVELAALWLAVAVLLGLTDRRLRDAVHPTAAMGSGYAVAVFLLPAPTLSFSYPFVFSVVGVGLVGAVAGLPERGLHRLRGGDVDVPIRAAVTGLTALTVAAAAYAVAYLAIA